MAAVALLQTSIGAYRQPVVDALSQALDNELTLVSGEEHFAPTTRLGVDLPGATTVVRNRFLLGRRLLWQVGVEHLTRDARVVIAEFNPRILSTWWLLRKRSLFGRSSILWGHGGSRRHHSAHRVAAWRRMSQLADAVVVYTDSEATKLRGEQWPAPVYSAPNSLWPREMMVPAIGTTVPKNFLFVGRFIESKKPLLLIRGFARAVEHLPPRAQLVMIGDGPQLALLRREATILRIDERVCFVGSVSEPRLLRPHYEEAVASVSPGYVGLSLIQSLGFGVPQIIARDEPHSPEIEAAIEGENCAFFASDSIEDLAAKLRDVSRASAGWMEARPQISQRCAMHYSVERTVEGLLQAVGHTGQADVPVRARRSPEGPAGRDVGT